MGETEEYFPRGGKKPTVTHFKQSSNFLGTAEKSDKKKRKPKKKAEGDDGYLSDEVIKEVVESYKNCAVGISYKTVKSGLLILGRVRQIQDTKISLSLPCRMLGTVMACHVSEPFNKLLEAYVNDQADSVRDLNTMFRPGQYVAAKVLEANTVEGRTDLLMSLMPQHVNSGRTHADLHNGALLQAAVCSVEDHGYVMDIGIPNTTAFLPKKHANPELELDIGMVTWCSVKSCKSDNSVVTLSCELSSLQAGLQRKSTNVILPGTGVDFVVDKPLDNGIEGHIFKDTTCYVQRQHADTRKGKKPALGQKVRARVLYVMPTRNTPFLTLRDIFESTYPDVEREQKHKAGDIVEEAQVIKTTGRCVHFKLGSGCSGVMNLKWVATDDDLSDEEVLAKSYPLGSKHRVRVMSYNMFEHSFSVSDQPALLTEKYFSLDQLSVGQVVTATVKSVDSHVLLNVGRVTGIVPHSHLSDAGVFVDPKKATKPQLHKKKYKVGQEVTGRVLAIDVSKQSLSVTLKPSLLASSLVVLQSYEQATVGAAYTGVIKYIKEDYILVSFFNNVIAYVPKWHVTKEEVAISDAFHVGQIVNCTILRVDVEAKKMNGSLTVAPFTPGERPAKRKQNTDDDDGEESPKKKHKSDEQTDKKRKKKTSETEEDDLKSKKKDKKKRQTSESQDEGDSKQKKNKDKEVKSSEESDAIEIDLPDDILTPDDLNLIDLTDCVNAKKTKKRVLSLLKAISARMKRVDKIESKISSIEEKGLNATNKKYHTAMQMEKSVVLERVKKLFDVLTVAQERLKEFGEDDGAVEYKKMKELRAQKQEAKRKEKEEKLKEKKMKIKEDNQDNDKEHSEMKHKPKKEKRNVAEENVTEDSKEEKKKEKKKIVVEVPIVESIEPAIEMPSAKDFWSTNAEILSKSVQDEESSSSEDEDKDQPKKKRKKLSAAEKVAKVREEEERVREMERRAIESESRPQSSEQFERALLANPDSSQLWIAYMAFHLQATEIDKARSVARKALTTINFREEQERLNVWLALLNCENRFGTKESQQKTLEEALQMNDTYKLHTSLLDVYQETSKQQELSSLVELMMRKYKRNPQCYIACGDACYKAGLVDKARQVMQKGLAVLEKKEHVSVLVQFALLERSIGARERSEALFEQVLAVYPQRVDVVSVYVDMLVKGGDLDHVRQVMERMTSQKLPARKMKILYKKWIEVEEKIGDEEQVEKIRQRAMEYIEKAKF